MLFCTPLPFSLCGGLSLETAWSPTILPQAPPVGSRLVWRSSKNHAPLLKKILDVGEERAVVAPFPFETPKSPTKFNQSRVARPGSLLPLLTYSHFPQQTPTPSLSRVNGKGAGYGLQNVFLGTLSFGWSRGAIWDSNLHLEGRTLLAPFLGWRPSPFTAAQLPLQQ